MKINCRYTNFSCVYRSGTQLYNTICFSDGFNDREYDEKLYSNYKCITYYWINNKQHQQNFCFFNYEEQIEYLNTLSEIFGFKIISISKYKNHTKAQIKIINNRRYILYVSTYIRYIYEYPQSLICYMAWKDRNNYPNLNVVTLINLYITMFCGIHMGHIIGVNDYIIPNIHPKNLYSIFLTNFRPTEYFINTKYCWYDSIIQFLYEINTKRLPDLEKYCHNIINKIYNEYKKDIHRWESA